MKNSIWNIITTIILLVIACSLIVWSKEAVKAFITGGVVAIWIEHLVKKLCMKS